MQNSPSNCFAVFHKHLSLAASAAPKRLNAPGRQLPLHAWVSATNTPVSSPKQEKHRNLDSESQALRRVIRFPGDRWHYLSSALGQLPAIGGHVAGSSRREGSLAAPEKSISSPAPLFAFQNALVGRALRHVSVAH